MSFLTVTVELKLPVINGLQRVLSNGSAPEIDAVMRQWGARYRAFAQKRFNEQSRGGGEWPPLKNDRRHGRDKKAADGKRIGKRARGPSILRDTGILYAALNPSFQGDAGAFQQLGRMQVEVGYGGPSRHKTSGGKLSKATIADIVRFHNEGLGRLPVRKIIVVPSPAVMNGCARDMERGLKKIMDRLKTR